MLATGDRVLAGVSGGADSVSLALVLKELGYPVAVAHLNHGLRGIESDQDAEFTCRLAETLHLPFFLRKVDVRSCGGNLEAAGRFARKEFFRATMEEHGFSKLALAHNRDDRVETFLLHLFRGSGPEGLTSMAPVSGQTIRPLIEASRREIEDYLRSVGQSWRTDATNFDVSFSRNRLRLHVIPELAVLFNPRLAETLSRTIEVLEDEDAWLRIFTERWLREHGVPRPGEFALDAAALHDAPPALARRVIRAALREAGCTLEDVRFEHIENARALSQPGKSGKTAQFPGGVEAAREFSNLVFRPAAVRPPEFEHELPIPGEVWIPEANFMFRAEIVPPEGASAHAHRVLVDGGRVGACVRIRNWKPGDYYRPAGWPAGKLKKLFQRAKIPRSQRHRWPVVVADAAIVWVASFPVSRDFTPRRRSQKIVAFEALPV